MMNIEGYWYNPYNATAYPMPVANETPFDGKETFLSRLALLEEKANVVYFKGFSICRICNCANGNREYNLENWHWPQGYRHYVETHNVIPSEAFMQFVMENKNI